MPLMARLLDSVAPQVEINSLALQCRRTAISKRAVSTSVCARSPNSCCKEAGLANAPSIVKHWEYLNKNLRFWNRQFKYLRGYRATVLLIIIPIYCTGLKTKLCCDFPANKAMGKPFTQ